MDKGDDTEAEAALLALGRRLTWSQPMPYADSSFWLGRDKQNPGGNMYAVRFENPPASIRAISPTYASPTPWRAMTVGSEEGSPRVVIGGKDDPPPHKYCTVDEAKAACERHHTTEDWE